MKQIVLFIYMTLLFSRVYGQISVYQSPDVQIDREMFGQDTIELHSRYVLYLGENEYVLKNHYENHMNFEFKHNQPKIICTSFGKYAVKGDDIIMVDSVSGFSMRATIEDSGTIVFGDCFIPLKGTVFTYCQQGIDSIMRNGTKETLQPVNGLCEAFRTNKPFRMLKTGVYTDDMYLKLDLKSNGRYLYYFDNKHAPISAGRWKQDGMLLILQDDGLDKPFYAFVNNHVLNVDYLPGAFDSRDFEYVKFDPSAEEMVLPAFRGDSIFARFSVNLSEHSSFFVSFSGNEYYMSHVVWLENDFAMMYEPSYGGFTKKGNMLYLTDSVCGFEMQFELSEDTTHITQRRGFSSLNGKDLAFKGKAWETAPVCFDREIEEDRQMFITYASQTQLCPYQFGCYCYRDGIELHLYDDGRFTYKIAETIFLEGKASREGNLLVFKDNIIEEPFHALIEGDGIVSILPGLYGQQKAKAVAY